MIGNEFPGQNLDLVFEGVIGKVCGMCEYK